MTEISLFSEEDLDPDKIEKERAEIEEERKKKAQEKKEEKKEEVPSSGKTLFLVDGYSIIYKGFFAYINKPILDGEGNNISAYYGFFQILFSILKNNEFDALAVTMDEKEPTFRHIMYPQYKQNRDKTSEDLHRMIDPIKSSLNKIGIPVLSKSGYEADDVMASVADKAKKEGWNVVIVSADKDLCQLVDDRVHILRPSKPNDKEYILLDRKAVYENYGVYPEQIVDYLSLLGDASDNVPGVKGIGSVTAVRLLNEYVTLSGIYRHLDSLKNSERKKLEEGRESAELSKSLIVLSLDALPPSFDIERSTVDNFAIDRVVDDFKKLNMNQMAARAKSLGKVIGKKEEKSEEVILEEVSQPLPSQLEHLTKRGEYTILKEKGEVSSILSTLSSISLFLLFDEEDVPSPLLGFSFSYSINKAYYVPISQEGISEEEFREIWSIYFSSGKIKVIAHSAKSILRYLWSMGLDCIVERDTMIESWLISSNDGSFALDKTVSKYLAITLLDKKDLVKKEKLSSLPLSLLSLYSSQRADYTYRMSTFLLDKLREKGLEKIYREMELPLIRILGRMEKEGIYLSKEKMQEIKEKTDSKVRELEERIYSEAGYKLNINSTMQLSKLLYEERGLEHGKKTQRGFSTDTETLEKIKNSGDPIVSYILEYRQLAKLKSTYIDTLPSLADDNGRIHTSFLQTGTATGRLSSRSPNLQNIPVRTEEGRMIRSAFVPENGRVFISADYSQIELVVLSWLSSDSTLMEAFRSGLDVHKHTAAMIFNKSIDSVTSTERRVAKTINFGIMYGMSAYRLSNELDITRSEATEFIARYFQRYSKVREFVEKVNKEAEEKGYVKTYWGHVREIVGINSSNKTERAGAERTAVNTIIQGTAAEIMKKAMIDISLKMEKLGLKSKILLQVHDELIFEAEEDEKEALKALIRESMENVVKLPVPLHVSIEDGMSWGDMH